MQGWGDRNILSDEKHVLQGLTNTVFTWSQCGLCDFNAGKIVSATRVVKLQCVFIFVRNLVFASVYRGNCCLWWHIRGNQSERTCQEGLNLSPRAYPFAAATQLPHPSSLRWRAKKQDVDSTQGAVESPYSCRSAGSRMEDEEMQLFLPWQHCRNLGNRSLPLGMGSASPTPTTPLPVPVMRCYRIKSNSCCILSVFTLGTLWSVHIIFYLCFFVCYMS